MVTVQIEEDKIANIHESKHPTDSANGQELK